jgi:plastocyanin
LIGVASLAGCGKTAPGGKTAAESKGGSTSEQSTKAPESNSTRPSGSKETGASATRGAATEHVGGKNVVQLSDRRCVYFEPRWAGIRVGESVTWHSGLKSPVTIHVASGAFDRTEFKIPAGGTVSSGPARIAGSFSIWCDPAACQVSPHGVEGSGPGVMVSGK